MKQMLFVCVENSNRSQMAQAFAFMYGKDIVEAFSAGSKPSGKVNPKAIEAMKEIGYDLSKHNSKSLNDIPETEYEYVVTMGCGDECPYVKAKHREEWDIPDPRNMEMEEVKKVRDLIASKVKELLKKV
jgi:arsenate reductase